MKLIVSKRATRRLREISDYIHNDNPAAARDVQQALRNALALIASRPGMGRKVLPDVRSFALPRLPYLIYYRVDEKEGHRDDRHDTSCGSETIDLRLADAEFSHVL